MKFGFMLVIYLYEYVRTNTHVVLHSAGMKQAFSTKFGHFTLSNYLRPSELQK